MSNPAPARTEPSTSDSVGELRTALQAAATAAGRSIPSGGPLTPGEPVVDPDETGVMPWPAARAVSAGVKDHSIGHAHLVITAEVAAAIENGPVGEQSLLAVLEPALTDALEAIEETTGHPAELLAPHEVEAVALLAAPGEGALVAVPLLDGDEHLATLAVTVGQSGFASTTARDPHAVGSFEPIAEDVVSAPADIRPLDRLHNIEMAVTVELGRTRLTVRDLLGLTPGAVVELDRTAGSPLDVLVNGTLLARGEVVVIDEEFAVRITEIVGTAEGTQADAGVPEG